MAKRKKYSKIIHSIIKLTPQIAQKLLDTQIDIQRKLSKNYVKKYAEAFEKGLWKFAADPIRVDWFGNLIDGQHRCEMVILTKKSIKVLIVYGLDPEVYKVIDSGKRRNLSDALAINGEKSCKVLASTLALLYHYLEDGKERISPGRGTGETVSLKLQTEEALQLLEKNTGIRDSIKKVYPVGKVMHVSAAVFCHYLFSKKDADAADDFFNKLATGIGLTKRSPILALREAFLFDKLEAKTMPRGHKIALTNKAWNMCRKGKTCTKISWRPTHRKKSGEDYPKRNLEPIPKII